jgi:hypothetical protein
VLTVVATGAGVDGGHGRAGEGKGRWPRRRKRRWRERGFWLRVSGGGVVDAGGRGCAFAFGCYLSQVSVPLGKYMDPVGRSRCRSGRWQAAADVQLPFDFMDRGLRCHATRRQNVAARRQPTTHPPPGARRSQRPRRLWVALEISCV